MQQAIDFLSEQDEIFRTIIEKYGLPKVPWRPQGFETLVLLIMEQQVSIESAKTTFLRLKDKVVLFEPEALYILPDEEYRSVGVSRQKTSYIKGLSLAIINKELDVSSLATKSAEQVRAELIKIKGIGNWTIDIYLMFALEATDIMPLGDIAVINTIKELLDIQDRELMEAYIQKWSPYRSFATFLLWHYYLGKRNRKVNY